jgi:hypothetical protein
MAHVDDVAAARCEPVSGVAPPLGVSVSAQASADTTTDAADDTAWQEVGHYLAWRPGSGACAPLAIAHRRSPVPAG